jgi:hypothetical protein
MLRRALCVLPELDGGEYIEGWIVDAKRNRVSAHGWIVVEDRIVDPLRYSLLLFYFPGKSFAREEILKEAQRKFEPSMAVGEPSLLCRLNQPDAHEEAFAQSRQAALAFADELDSKLSLVWRQTGKDPVQASTKQQSSVITGNSVSKRGSIA